MCRLKLLTGSYKRLVLRLIGLGAVPALALLLLPSSQSLGGPGGQPGIACGPLYFSASDRFGVDLDPNAHQNVNIGMFDVAALNVGWYMDWTMREFTPHPNGVDFVQTVRICSMALPAPGQIARVAQANPGALWLISNEPDSIWQDSCRPERYAQDYHTLYTWIKQADPTARVAAGGIIQATPLRMRYLDLILAAYQSTYGQPLPVDAWHIHAFVLREDRYGWGASIPPGVADDTGLLYAIRDTDNMAYFAEQIVRFRQWMADHGWRTLPLHVDEYGSLMPGDYVDEDGRPFDDARLQAFMTATFDYFLSATDPTIGCPADGNRLVQSWAWYSLQDNRYDEQGQLLSEMYNGDLFGGYLTKTLTSPGQAFAAYVAPLVTPYVDLYPDSLGADVGQAWLGSTYTLTLTAQVANRGNTTSTLPGLVRFTSSQGGGHLEGALGAVPRRYAGTASVVVTWMAHITGANTITLEVDPLGTTADVNDCNDVRSFELAFTADAIPHSIAFSPPVLLFKGEPLTVTARADVVNPGNVAVRDVQVEFWREGVKLETVYITTLSASGRASRYATWVETQPGVKEIVVRVSSPATPQRQLVAKLFIADHAVFLPIVSR